jgi:hypothetical protein
MSRRPIVGQAAWRREVGYDAGQASQNRPMTAPGTEARSITVTVTLFADLRRFLPRGVDGPQRYSLAAGACVADLLKAIGITAAYDVTVGVDGELATDADVLRDGADVMLLSPMEGGSQGDPICRSASRIRSRRMPDSPRRGGRRTRRLAPSEEDGR